MFLFIANLRVAACIKLSIISRLFWYYLTNMLWKLTYENTVSIVGCETTDFSLAINTFCHDDLCQWCALTRESNA